MAEAIAMKEGLIVVNTRGFDSVIAESDSTEITEACSGAERWWTESAAVYVDCVGRMHRLMQRLGPSPLSKKYVDCVDYATTIGNQVAHEIARFCFSNNISCNWIDEPPSFLLDRLINDVTEY
jgi:ribonuclease HI